MKILVRSFGTTLIGLCLGLFVADAVGQEQLPSAPNPQVSQSKTQRIDYYDPYISNAGVLCGGGASTSSAGTKPTFGCGAGVRLPPYPMFIEVGVMGPQANRSDYTGYITIDQNIPLIWKGNPKYEPIAFVGYSRLFETGNAFDYGVALATPRFIFKGDQTDSMRFEVRDYWTAANPTQHNVMFRIGLMTGVYND